MKLINCTPVSGDMLKAGLGAMAPGMEIEIVDVHQAEAGRIIEAVRGAQVMLGDYTFNTPVTREIVAAMDQMRLIQQPSAGYNNIDIEACKKAGIAVANAPGANDLSVAEHTVMLGLVLAKNLIAYNRATHEGRWLFTQADEMGLGEVAGKTWGFVGMGRTARAVVKRLIPFEARMVYYDLYRLSQADETELGLSFMDMDEILKSADIVSLHLPLTKQTRGLINRESLALMKPGAVLINVGRGELVDEAALAEALRERKIKAAGLDVFSQEPIREDNPFKGLDNAILTPHIAGSTPEAGQRIFRLSLANVVRALKGEKPMHLL